MMKKSFKVSSIIMKNMSPLDQRVVGLDEIIYGKRILRHPVYPLQSITIPQKLGTTSQYRVTRASPDERVYEVNRPF